MFANIDDWKSDRELEAGGVPLDLGKGRAIILKRAGGSNKLFMVAVAEVIRRVMGDRLPEEVPDSEIDDELKVVYADKVAVGWKGFKDDDGDDIPFTRENFLELMRLAPDMWMKVRASANTREMFQVQKDRTAISRDKEAIKKSLRGKRNGAHSAHA